MTIFDTDFAISQLNGNHELLCRLLNKFIDDYRDTGNTVSGLVAAQNYSEATMLVHTVKGVTGNLGMKALHKESDTLEQVCKSGNVEPAQITPFSECLNDTVSAIERYINE